MIHHLQQFSFPFLVYNHYYFEINTVSIKSSISARFCLWDKVLLTLVSVLCCSFPCSWCLAATLQGADSLPDSQLPASGYYQSTLHSLQVPNCSVLFSCQNSCRYPLGIFILSFCLLVLQILLNIIVSLRLLQSPCRKIESHS